MPEKGGLIAPLSIILLQEMGRFNKLINKVTISLEQLQKGIEGSIVMSQDLDEMYSSILNSQVPETWTKIAYPSLKPLSSWFEDLVKRTEFMRLWLTQGKPASFWLPSFFYPQSFLTSILQTFARKHQLPIDKLNFAYEVLDIPVEALIKPPENGAYIYGLFIQGARWDEEAKALGDQWVGYELLPVVHFIPKEDYKQDENTYTCPVYNTSVITKDVLRKNYITCIHLPTTQSQDYWILKGTALLCQLND